MILQSLSTASSIVYTIILIIVIGFLTFLLWKSIKKTYLKEKDTKANQIEGVATKGEINSFISSYISKFGSEAYFSLIYVDLDKFEDFEMAFGKKESHNVIKLIAQTIKNSLPEQTVLSRYTGDDFMVFLPKQYNRLDVINTAESLLKAFQSRLVIKDEIEVDLTASIAVVQYPNHGKNISHLLQSIQLSIHNVKKDGGNALRVYSKSLNSQEEEMNYYYQIKRAIAEKQFTFHYQPIVDHETNEIYAFEALLRWEHPELGTLAPNRFFNIMEQTGDIHWVGLWGLETLIQKHYELRQTHKTAPYLTINLSPKQLLNPDIAEEFQKVLNKNKISAENFILEIGEFLIFERQPVIFDNLTKLKNLNFKLAIDEFGIDIASFDQIEKMGIDIFKIDSKFLTEDTYSVNKYMEYFMEFAEKREKLVIAQGVETEEMETRAKGFGICKMQGYYYSKPIEDGKISDFINKNVAK